MQEYTSWNAGKKCNYKPHADKHAYRSFPSTHTWSHLQELNHFDKPQTQTQEAPQPASCPHTCSRAFVYRQGFARVPGYTRPPTGIPLREHTRANRSPRPPARRGSVGSRGWGQGRVGPERRGAGPRRPGRGRGAGAGWRPAHVGGREQLKVCSGAWAVLSRAALARAAAGKEAEEEEEEEGGGGGGERRGEDGGGVGLEPSGGASCPGRCRELARRAPIPELHPAVPSSARVRAPAGSAPGLPPE